MLYRILIIKLLVFAFTLLSVGQCLHAQPGAFQEDQIKAVFLYNLTNFITWPEESFENPNSPLKIRILGKDTFGPFLDKVVQGESVKGRNIVVERGVKIEDLCSCNILFISSSIKNKLPAIFKVIRECNVLTVGDVEGFANLGVTVNLIPKSNRMSVEINIISAKNAGLEISSKLLNVATIVKSIQLEGNK